MMASVRHATAREIDDLLALWSTLEQAQEVHRIFPTVPDAPERVRAMLLGAMEREDACVLVSEADERIVAMAMVTIHDQGTRSLSGARVVELSRVVVAPAARKGGVGRALVNEALAFGREHGAAFASAKVFSGNAEGIAFWERIGFVPRYEERVRPI